MNGAEDVAGTGPVLFQTEIQVQGTLFGLDDVQQADLGGVLGQKETAADSPLRADDARLDERLQNFGEKGTWVGSLAKKKPPPTPRCEPTMPALMRGCRTLVRKAGVISCVWQISFL